MEKSRWYAWNSNQGLQNCSYVLGNFGNIWITFIPTSVHTVGVLYFNMS